MYNRLTLFFSLGYIAKDNSFYASLHAEPASQNQDASVHTEFSLQDRGSIQTEQTNELINSEYRFVNLLSYYNYIFINDFP